jgi:uncharacterized protein (TIGR03083 family)
VKEALHQGLYGWQVNDCTVTMTHSGVPAVPASWPPRSCAASTGRRRRVVIGRTASLDTGMVAARPPDLGARLLLTERDALLPILRRTPADAFHRPSVCTGWTVRDVLAHCGAALMRLAEGRLHEFTPELNELDVAERRSWPLATVVAELVQGYAAAAPALTAARGKLDAVALGEWVHGGDVREALGAEGSYESDGVEDALLLLVERSRRQGVPATLVRLPDRELRLGVAEEGGYAAELVADVATLVRLCSGRHPDRARFWLKGTDPAQYHLFR